MSETIPMYQILMTASLPVAARRRGLVCLIDSADRSGKLSFFSPVLLLREAGEAWEMGERANRKRGRLRKRENCRKQVMWTVAGKFTSGKQHAIAVPLPTCWHCRGSLGEFFAPTQVCGDLQAAHQV